MDYHQCLERVVAPRQGLPFSLKEVGEKILVSELPGWNERRRVEMATQCLSELDVGIYHDKPRVKLSVRSWAAFGYLCWGR